MTSFLYIIPCLLAIASGQNMFDQRQQQQQNQFSPQNQNQFSPQNQMRPIQCFSCLSGTLSDQSRAMFEQNGAGSNVPIDLCDDPFKVNNQQLQPCMTSCVKSVSENQFTRVVLRGCLTDVAQQLQGRTPNLRIPAPGQCIDQTVENVNLGQVKTKTCLCDENGCNAASAVQTSLISLTVLLSILYLCY